MHSSKIFLRAAAGIAGFALCLTAAQAQITPGNLVVVRVGDGSAALTNAATRVFLDEFTTAGALVQSIALPTAASGPNQPFANSGSATSEGLLNLSADGQYLVQGGYGSIPGLASIASTASATIPRVIARTDLNGVVDTSTALDAFTGNNIRSATSTNGTDLWAAGANGGVQYATLGATTATAITAPALPTNLRMIQIVSGQLYVSSASGAFQGVSSVGAGTPTTAGQTITLLSGFPVASGPSSYDYFFSDASTLYVADDRTNGSGGIQKWTESAGTWTLAYTLAPATNVGCRGLSGVVQGGQATLYASTTASSLNSVVSVVDTGAGAPFTTVTTAGTNTIFRGLRLIPVPPAPPITALCFGDGTGTACPCGNVGLAGNGCANSLSTSGSNLAATGTPSISNDTLVLTGTLMPNSSVLYFQGTTAVGGGSGSVFGDGLRCAGGSVIRLGTKTNALGTSSYPVGGDLSVSVRGSCAVGNTRIYQAWYRNAASFCTASTFNLTNALSLTWGV